MTSREVKSTLADGLPSLMRRTAPMLLATYGKGVLTHAQLMATLRQTPVHPPAAAGAATDAALLTALDACEQEVRGWDLSRWELRVPPEAMYNGQLKIYAKSMLETVKTQLPPVLQEVGRGKEAAAGLAALLNTTPGELPKKGRDFVAEVVAEKRYGGDVHGAMAIKKQWDALERYGGSGVFAGSDHRLLERCCLFYMMMRLNSFAESFTNVIRLGADGQHRLVMGASSFDTLREQILRIFPTIDVACDFAGLLRPYGATQPSYLGGLVTYLSAHKLPITQVAPRTLLHANHDKKHVTLVQLADHNKWLRESSLPPRQQLDGISRRASLIFGKQYATKMLLLPPTRLDHHSLARINTQLLGAVDAEYEPWVKLYRTELAEGDLAFDEFLVSGEQRRKITQKEEWVKL